MKSHLNLHKIFPSDDMICTLLTMDIWDADFLKKELRRLPAGDHNSCPVTLLCDYDGSVTVHPDNSLTAFKLARSQYDGDAFVLQTDRRFLYDALLLGTFEFHFGGKFPVATTEGKIYCWCPIDCDALPLESERPYAEKYIRSDQY